ncbi:MAG: MFS transporter [Deltaproteobacteria bacterium]|nr:MFS transporter [Deltaproteobacteria bacterium]
MFPNSASPRLCARQIRKPKEPTSIRILHSLRYRDYALFWSTDLLSSIGHFVQEVALFWITYEITHSAMALGILGLCGTLPRLLLGAFSGVFVDRYDRKLLLILVQFVSAIPIAIFLVVYFFGTLQFWHLLVLEVVFGSIRAINPSAAQSILSELVPRDDLMNAVSLYTFGFNIARIVGPSLGGVAIIWIGIGGCFAAFAITLLLSGVGMLFIHPNRAQNEKRQQGFVREFKEGFDYVWGTPVILSSVIAAYTFAVFIVTYQSFLPVFAKEILKVGPDGLGLLMAAPGIGALASLSFLASVGERWNKAMLLWITTTTTPIFLILFCLSPTFWLSVALLALVGAGQVCFRTISRVIIQIEAPRTLMGRVMSVFNLDQGMRSVGSMVLGAAATWFGASLGLALAAGASLIVTTTIFYRLLGRRH